MDKALQKGNHHGWALVMMVFFAVAREGLESVFFLLAASFSRTSASGRRWGAARAGHRGCAVGFLLYWGGIRFLTWACSSNGPACLFCWWPLAGRGAIRAFHEAGLWNLFQDVPFDLSRNLLSTHTLTGTLLEGIFGYQETPSVSEVAMYFIYLVPALILFALPPRTGSQTVARCRPGAAF